MHLTAAAICQFALLAYHQITTLVDFHPFNGSRHYPRKWKIAEAGGNGVMMSLPLIGFLFHVRPLMIFGVGYYFVLFAAELIIWWVPYFSEPSGRWRRLYNRMLGLATSNFEKGDTLDHWVTIYRRLHRGTITFLPEGKGRIVPNLEHTLLHAWTLVTAVVTALAFFAPTP